MWPFRQALQMQSEAAARPVHKACLIALAVSLMLTSRIPLRRDHDGLEGPAGQPGLAQEIPVLLANYDFGTFIQ